MNSLEIKLNYRCSRIKRSNNRGNNSYRSKDSNKNHHRSPAFWLRYCCCWLCIFIVVFIDIGSCSEFPERECCDLTTTTSTITPLSIPPIQATEKTITTSSASVQPITVGRSGKIFELISVVSSVYFVLSSTDQK